MSQRVPSWDLDDPPNLSHLRPSSSSAAAHLQLSMFDNEVAELTWENGQLSAHGLVKPTTRQATGTLESVVDQAKLLPSSSSSAAWNQHQHQHGGPQLVDALVPSAHLRRRRQRGGSDDLASGIGSCNVDRRGKRARCGDTGTAASIDSTRVAADDTDDFGFATTNSVTPPFPDDGNGVSGSPDTENTSFVVGGRSRPLTGADDHDSVCHSLRSLSQREMAREDDEKITKRGTVRSSVSTKRSRAAAVHNQSERKRRDRINQKMRTLQKLVPNSNKADKASMLDEAIEYLKQLQAQVQMMSRMSSISPMMIPVSMQQFQMTMMAQMAQIAQMAQMGMGMGMGMMDMASLARTGPTGVSPVMPGGTFLPVIGAAGAWDPSAAAAAERMQQPVAGSVMSDRFSAFVACPPQQQVTMDAYQRMAALQQQMYQNLPTNPK